MDDDRSGIAEQARQDAVMARLLDLAEDLHVPVQRAYVDGPVPPWPVTVVVFESHAGLGPDDDREQFAGRFRFREIETIRDMPDGLLAEHVGRLRRQRAMADQDGLPDWYVELLGERSQQAEREWSWRHQAANRSGSRIDNDRRWRDRIETIREQTDLAMLIAYECEQARPAGLGKWQCCCPFHADKTPSLSIDVGKGLWVCHGCNVGGDAFTYVELRFGLDFSAAVTHLEDRLGIPPPAQRTRIRAPLGAAIPG